MGFRRNLFGSPPSLLANLPRLRNKLVAERERLAREEAKAVERVDTLRDIMDSMSNELAQRQIDPTKTAALILKAGARARGEIPQPLPPVGSTARMIVNADRKRRGLAPYGDDE
jgi:hypothetical protein